MRPCLKRAAILGLDKAGSHSLVKLALANEYSGSKTFKCDTLIAMGLCIYENCEIYCSRIKKIRGVPVGAGRGSGREPRVDNANVPTSSSNSSLEKSIDKMLGFHKKGYRKRNAY